MNWYCADKASSILTAIADKELYQVIISLNRFAHQNKRFFQAYFRDNTNIMDTYRKQYISAFFEDLYLHQRRAFTKVQLDRIMLLYTFNGALGILKEWVLDGCKLTAEEFSQHERAVLADKLVHTRRQQVSIKLGQ